MNLNKFIQIVLPYTMTSIERITELYNSLEYIRKNKIYGDIVECGVWKGGNILGIIEYLHHYQIYDKKVWLYDTFKGMTKPTNDDYDFNNRKAEELYGEGSCLSTIDEVKNVLLNSNFNKNNLNFIIGDVSETLLNDENIPNKISLLRLDTDWYKSTKDELKYLYPKLNDFGILIVDDYGHWHGSKKAVDEYFENKDILLEYIDYTGIKITKKNK